MDQVRAARPVFRGPDIHYKFLEGMTLTDIDTGEGYEGIKPLSKNTAYVYHSEEPVAEVVAKATLELAPADGWTFEPKFDTFVRDPEHELVFIYVFGFATATRPAITEVDVVVPTGRKNLETYERWKTYRHAQDLNKV